MKMPLIWHENGLKVLQRNLVAYEEKLVRAQSDVFRLRTMILKLEYQIAEAKRQKKDGFDEDLFLQRRGTPCHVSTSPIGPSR